jgi:hypothetical protein
VEPDLSPDFAVRRPTRCWRACAPPLGHPSSTHLATPHLMLHGRLWHTNSTTLIHATQVHRGGPFSCDYS